MSSSPGGGGCLVARAVPLPKNIEQNSSQKQMKARDVVDALVNDLTDLKINNNTSSSKCCVAAAAKKSGVKADGSGTREAAISPADYISMQSLQSSMKANKMNTTIKVSRHNLMADLLSFNDDPVEVVEKNQPKEIEKPEEKTEVPQNILLETVDKKEDKEEVKEAATQEKVEDNKSEEKSDDSDLMPRGPVRSENVRATTRTPANNYHPYVSAASHGAAPQSRVADPSAYNSHNSFAYDCGVPYYYTNEGREYCLSNSSTPDTVNSDLGYGSATSPPYMMRGAYAGMQQNTMIYEGGKMGFEDLCSDMKSSAIGRLQAAKLDSTELPDSLCDFILKYSRRYTPSVDGSTSSRKTSWSTLEGNSPKGADHEQSNSLCNSPLSAGSAPRNSPAAPYGGVSDPSTPPHSAKLHNRCAQQFAAFTNGETPLVSKQVVKRPAKERLRAMIGNEEMDEAWAWTCKFIQESSECLSYQDHGGDTLLHIVVCQPNIDLAKIYALVEQMLKMDSELSHKPFDVPNKWGETPMFMAVQKRHNKVVDYLLEAGACPNVQNSRPDREAPLHYAAARGMVDIVQTLCSYPTKLNMLNGMGLTPLLCAVKNHGVLEEESHSIIDNKTTIQLLLKCGADPTITDSTNGKSVIMYAVERMNAEIIEIFQSNLTEEAMAELVNKPDLCQETPMSALLTLGNVDSEVSSKLGLTLITCGASSN